MLYRNSIFMLDGERYRLLHVMPNANMAFGISLDKKTSRTRKFLWSEVSGLDDLAFDEKKSLEELSPSQASIEVRNEALRLLGDLITQAPVIFDDKERGRLIANQALKMGCSKSVLYKHLINYFQGGQTPSALLGRFNNCGKNKGPLSTVCGAATAGGEPKYLLTDKDLEHFKSVITEVYLKDARISIAATYKRLLKSYYRAVDGNGDKYLSPIGQYPSLRQFEYYLRKNYPTNVRQRARIGNKAFELNERAILGSVLADCQGVGHYYEADASIADVYLRASDDISKIIGKPTIYFITDRKSRLIVGWYIGLENASWVCALQAMISISQDKAAICRRLGITYDPNDWPADGVYPQSVLVDRGEWTSKVSTQLADEMATDVVYVPAKRGDWKPTVESDFKCFRVAMQDGVPGMDPPENAKKRQGIKYDKDACLTLEAIERIFVLYIINHNRTPDPKYRLSLGELEEGVSPDPISLWNHGIQDRTGALSRYDESFVRRTLLPRATASITAHGVSVNGCFYTCNEAEKGGWFELARKKNLEVRVSYDRRLVDVLYVQDPFKNGRTYQCKLTSRSQEYSGKSVAEVYAIEKFRKAKNAEFKHQKLGLAMNFQQQVEDVVKPAKKQLKDAKLKVSRTAAKADTKVARELERSFERQSLLSVAPSESPAASALAIKPSAEVIHLTPPKLARDSLKKPESSPVTSAEIADPFKRINERLLHGTI